MTNKVNNLSPEQKRRLLSVAEIIEHGDIAVLKKLIEIEDKIEDFKEELQIIPLKNGLDGDKGDKGDKGDPGRDGRDGRDGEDGKDGKDGRDGKDGMMGTIDEATIGYLEDKIKEIEIRQVTSPQGRTGWGAHPLTVKDGSTTIDKNARIINFGNNLTVSRASDGTITVNGSAGGGGVTVETPTGTVNASNTSFTVSAEPTWVVSDGITYFANAGYSYAALTITMDVAPSSYIRAIV